MLFRQENRNISHICALFTPMVVERGTCVAAETPLQTRRNPLDTRGRCRNLAALNTVDQRSQLDQVHCSKRGPSRRERHKRIRRSDIGPRRGKHVHASRLIPHLHAIFAPVEPAVQQLERTTAERMERVSDPDSLSCTGG